MMTDMHMSMNSQANAPAKAIMCWSGGKDSAMALHIARQTYDVVALLTTLSSEFKRISMHGIREELLDQQAASIGLPLIKVWVGEGGHADYDRQMSHGLRQAIDMGVTHVVFGDIFLQDLRDYREKQLAKVGLQAVFPLWQRNTSDLITYFIAQQFSTVVCCVNDGYLDESWAGRIIDSAFVKQLPAAVDPCGENGEYHTFCYAGPIFNTPIRFTKADVVYRALPAPMPMADDAQSDDTYQCQSAVKTLGFWYCELLPLH